MIGFYHETESDDTGDDPITTSCGWKIGFENTSNGIFFYSR